jgi:hypothetical protein
MVSWLQHIAGRAREARYRPGAARFIAGPRRAADGSAAARIAALVAVVRVMWNMRKRLFSHSCKTAAARMAVKGGRSLPVHRSEAQTLDGHRSGGYARERARDADSAPILSFQHVYVAATLVTPAVTAHRPFRPEPTHSTRVDARKHVNASVYAVARCIRLALLTLTAEEPQVPLQQPAGGDVSHPPDAVGGVLVGLRLDIKLKYYQVVWHDSAMHYRTRALSNSETQLS